jgi:hypothetical protein
VADEPHAAPVTLHRLGAAGVAIALAVAACATGVPARIVEPTAESRAELHRVVTAALGGREITLADDALTSSSILTLEHALPDNAQRRAATGREVERPEVFRLLKVGYRCVLVHDSGARTVLTQVSCVPE